MCFFLFSTLLFLAEAHKFLLYETAFSRSHVQFAGRLIDVLVEEGHTVDVLMLQYNPNIATNGTTKFRKLHRVDPKNGEPSYWMEIGYTETPFQKGQKKKCEHCANKAIVQFCEALMSNDALIESLRSENYDAGFTMIYESCSFGLFHVLNIQPVIGYFATAMPTVIANTFNLPSPPSYVMNIFNNPGRMPAEFSFFDRLIHFKDQIYYTYFTLKTASNLQTHIFKAKYGETFPDLASLKSEMSLVFVNSESVLESPRPISNKIVNIGGIQAQTPKPLSMEFQKIYNNSYKGVIIFSFGSLFQTSNMPDHIKNSFLKAFSSFPDYTFIWKCDDCDKNAETLKNYSNVVVTKWMPQYDLLSDIRTKVFISHQGQNSFLEAAYAGVPVIGVPLFVDQIFNSVLAKEKGFGLKMDRFTVNEQTITEALNDVLCNPKYHVNAKKMSKMLRTNPSPPATFSSET
ncbi:hypothetical protein L596_010881 [Steinernema carpocapsae]|uniref:glucuronosyltransferase n=1 Tax=Steinernema carpocapsae TaxID=34508 RepID=A0A4U5PKJ3_STECR|nr:hypothetical protein L596_010881 [Steinernema carpocapsae]